MADDKPQDTEEARDWLAQVAVEPSELLDSTGCAVSNTQRLGDAANMILSEASDWGANSIFLGARGLGPVKRFFIGSVSSTVAAKAACSVEVIRQAE